MPVPFQNMEHAHAHREKHDTAFAAQGTERHKYQTDDQEKMEYIYYGNKPDRAAYLPSHLALNVLIAPLTKKPRFIFEVQTQKTDCSAPQLDQ